MVFGKTGKRLFAPFFGVAPPRMSETLAGAMTGPFERLPIELVQCIVVAVLSSDDALVSMLTVGNFLRTCRGAAAGVTRAHRLEATARAFLGGTLKPLPCVAPHRAYTELLLTRVRSSMELATVNRMLRDSTSHCASLTSGACCRASRESLNAELGTDEWWLRWGYMGAFLKEAMAPECPAMRVAVAAGGGSQVLCQTDRGAALVTNGGGCVRCVHKLPCEVFSPERELEVVFEKSFDDTVLFGASAGKLLAVVLKREVNNNPWDNKYALQVWDTGANAHVYTHEIASYPTKLWIVGEKVYWIVNGKPTGHHVWSMHLEHCFPLTGKSGSVRLPDSHTLDAVSVSRHAGHFAMIDANPARRAEHLIFFDVEFAQLVHIDSYARTTLWHRSIVKLSPLGDTLVVVGSSHPSPTTLIYRRCNPVGSRRLGWQLWKQIVPFNEAEFPQPGDGMSYPIQHGVFSPCGGIVCFFFWNHNKGQVMYIDMHRVLAGQRATPVVKDFLPMSIPTSKVVWGDGFFLPTGTGSGVLGISA